MISVTDNNKKVTIVITRLGTFVFPVEDEVIAKSMQLYGEWAGIELSVIENFIRAGDVVLDIGGYYGTHAISFAEMVGSAGRVITFEGSIANFDVLRENVVAYSGLGIIEPRQEILSASSEDLFELAINPTNFGASHPLRSSSFDKCAQLSGSSLDQINFEMVNFIKIDVEGMEDQVLRGAQALLRKFSPIVFFRVNTIEGGRLTISAFVGHNYDFFGCVTPLYNRNNAFNNEKNIFGNATECGVFAIPTNSSVEVIKALSNLNLPKISTPDDIALLLLHKPHYFNEVLAGALAAKVLEAPVAVATEADARKAVAVEAELAEFERAEVRNNLAVRRLQDELTDLKEELADITEIAVRQLTRANLLLERLKFAKSLLRRPLINPLKRNIAKIILENCPWLSQQRRQKLQHSIAKREYRNLTDVLDEDSELTLANLFHSEEPVYAGKSYDYGGVAPAVAPSEADWNSIVVAGGITAASPVVDVIVPAYRGFDETMRCLYSLISEVQRTPFRLIVINDCSPEPELTNALRMLSDRGWVTLIENEFNIGFVLSCNLGIRLNTIRDVILLNSDTEVYHDWLDRIISRAAKNQHAGSLTPFSNNATICSYPFFMRDNNRALEIDGRSIDSLVSHICINDDMVELPTAVGFCMYIRRVCLDVVGSFDEEKFGMGYGEECDLSRRILKGGWKNLIVPDVYVRHWGGVSFGSGSEERKEVANKTVNELHPAYHEDVMKFIKSDPLRPIRARIDAGRLAARAHQSATLFVTHDIGGGTETHIQHLRDQIEKLNSGCVFISRPHPEMRDYFLIEDLNCGPTPNLPLASWKHGTEKLSAFFRSLGITRIHVHHLLGHHRTASRALNYLAEADEIEVIFAVHDQGFTIGPQEKF